MTPRERAPQISRGPGARESTAAHAFDRRYQREHARIAKWQHINAIFFAHGLPEPYPMSGITLEPRAEASIHMDVLARIADLLDQPEGVAVHRCTLCDAELTIPRGAPRPVCRPCWEARQ